MQNKNFIKLEEGSKTYQLTQRQFYRIMEVDYLEHLEFSNYSIYNYLVKKCKKALKKAIISNKQIWLGEYYAKELLSGYMPDVCLKWINPIKEFGLFTNQDLKPFNFVGEYTGVIHKYRKRIDDKNPYCFEYMIGQEVKTPYTLDAREKGSLIRFVNHSFKPNLTPVAVFYQGLMHIIFRANRKIQKGEELTYHYGPNYWAKRETPI